MSINLDFLLRENRLKEAQEFFGWSNDIVTTLFNFSLNYYEGPWESLKHNPDLYYTCGFYTIRQLSYSISDISMKEGQLSRKECDEIIVRGGSVLEIGCGVGDLAIYLAKNNIFVTVTEHSGIPIEFLKYRFKKYQCEQIKILSESDLLPNEIDFIIANSVLDHIYNPIFFAEKLCKIAKKTIFARPKIDETYNRPAHDKTILKDLPAAFALIEAHNVICK